MAAGAVWLLRRFRRVEVVGESMRPTLEPGDRLLLLRTGTARPGQLVAVDDPRQPQRVVVKRLAAATPAGVTVLGDNPVASTDSRTFGCVSWSSLRGRVVCRYFPAERRALFTRRDAALGSEPRRSGLRPERLTEAGVFRGSHQVTGSVALVLQDELDRVLASDYLGDLSTRPLAEIRTLRAECTRAEAKLSYLRRLVQGRVDILVQELRRRSERQDPSELPALVDDLPEILSGNVHAPGHERLVATLHPPDIDEITTELDAMAGTSALGALSELSDDEVRALAERLSTVDREVSDQRRALHDQIDRLAGELTRRYKAGEATAETALS